MSNGSPRDSLSVREEFVKKLTWCKDEIINIFDLQVDKAEQIDREGTSENRWHVIVEKMIQEVIIMFI